MLGRVVIQPGQILLALIGFGIVCWVAALVIYITQRATRSAAVRRTRPLRKTASVFVIVLTVCVTIACAPAVLLIALLSVNQYEVLPGASDDGCHIVIERGDAMFSYGGRIFLQEPSGIRLVPTGVSWDRDRSEPSAEWNLVWNGEHAHLQTTATLHPPSASADEQQGNVTLSCESGNGLVPRD